MDYKTMQKLHNRTCEELDKIANKTGSMTTAEIDSMHKLIVAEEKLMKIEEMGGGYSQGRYSGGDGRWYAMGNYDNGYGMRDNSYGREGMHYVNGHYSREDGLNMMRDRMDDRMYDNMSQSDRMSLNNGMR